MTIATARTPPTPVTLAQATLFQREEPPPTSGGGDSACSTGVGAGTSRETRSAVSGSAAVGGSAAAGGTATGGPANSGRASDPSETGGRCDWIRALYLAQSTRVSRMKEGSSS